MAAGDRKRFHIPELELDIEAVENEDGEYEISDDNGSIWTETAFCSADGSVRETFGPGRKDDELPTIVRHLRALKRLS